LNSNFKLAIAAGLLYLLGVWLHFPFGGGHFYSDITTIFQLRIVDENFGIPYLEVFYEYPVIVGTFTYIMGTLASFFPGPLIYNYYFLTVSVLAIPTGLLVLEVSKIARMKGMEHKRLFLYLVVTPSFVVMLLLNWYVIGVFFMVYGLRKFLEGDRWMSGTLLGLSAASNFVTAVPAFGMILTAGDVKRVVTFVGFAVVAYVSVNAPFFLSNPSMWWSSWNYIYNFPAEGSWMLAFFPNVSPVRHILPPVIFGAISAIIVFKALLKGEKDTIRLSWLFTFAYLFSTYIFTPQMNIILLPFLTLAPIVRRYWEFLIFDFVNSFVIFGFSYASTLFFLMFGINYNFVLWGLSSPVQWAAIIRSAWVGKMTIINGLVRRPESLQKLPVRNSSL
jgi:hypothetical protein